jgi:hypothetical protein
MACSRSSTASTATPWSARSSATTRTSCARCIEGLSIDDEARLFHEINVRRKTLNFWDRWKARRAAGEPIVLEIEEVLAAHGLRVNPAPTDGNIAANVALERIVREIGDRWLLDSVLVILLAAFGRSRDAFQGPIMQGLALVLANYGPDELDRDHLVSQLTKLPVRQIRARAAGLREMHKGAEPRLIGAVIVDQYNKAHARPATGVPSRSSSRCRSRHRLAGGGGSSGPSAARHILCGRPRRLVSQVRTRQPTAGWGAVGSTTKPRRPRPRQLHRPHRVSASAGTSPATTTTTPAATATAACATNAAGSGRPARHDHDTVPLRTPRPTRRPPAR